MSMVMKMARGRPRKMDPKDVLSTAMKVFWEHGFDGTSMNDLVQETGMAKPGLYACFGDKETLYQKAVEHYFVENGEASLTALIESQGPIRLVIREFLEDIADFVTDATKPTGCFVVNSVIDCGHKPNILREQALLFNQKRTDAFIQRFERAKTEGELAEHLDARVLADFYSSQTLSYAVMARGGATSDRLKGLVNVAMSILDQPSLS